MKRGCTVRVFGADVRPMFYQRLGQILVLMGLILVYGGGSVFLCWELITDGKFAETGDMNDKIPLYIRFGIPTLFVGFGILFFTVLFQRLKAAKTDKYTDVQI